MNWKETANGAYRQARRVVVAVVGFTVVAIGLVLMVTPGPAFIVIPVGLAILATEFLWARRLLGRFKKEAKKWAAMGKKKLSPSGDEAEQA